MLEEREGKVVIKVTGVGAWDSFKHEAGGHRVQRVPPTEKRGRVQTSTITVALLNVSTETQVQILDRDLEVQATRGSGAGGQARNKVSSAVIVKHRPSGLTVRVETERSQFQNLSTAKELLRARLYEMQETAAVEGRNMARKTQVGAGQRGDKRRSVAIQRDQVVDHVLNVRTSAERYLKGDLSAIYAVR